MSDALLAGDPDAAIGVLEEPVLVALGRGQPVSGMKENPIAWRDVAASSFSPVRRPAVPKSIITVCSRSVPVHSSIRFSGLRSR